jgi:hypothetical protein
MISRTLSAIPKLPSQIANRRLATLDAIRAHSFSTTLLIRDSKINQYEKQSSETVRNRSIPDRILLWEGFIPGVNDHPLQQLIHMQQRSLDQKEHGEEEADYFFEVKSQRDDIRENELNAESNRGNVTGESMNSIKRK